MGFLHGLLSEYKKFDRTYALNEPSYKSESGERKLMFAINEDFNKKKIPLTVKLGIFTFPRIVGINKIKGNVRGDLALVQYDFHAKRLKDVGFISHKAGTLADHFQQYSGITYMADGSRPGSISDHAEVRSFVSDLDKIIMHDATAKEGRFYRPVRDAVLVGRAAFGAEYGTTNYSPNNVHALAQGTHIWHKSSANTVTLSFSAHLIMNMNVSALMSGEYKAVLGMRRGRRLIITRATLGGQAVEI